MPCTWYPVELGLRLQNTLGVLKLLVLALTSVSGILCLAGVKGIQVRDEYKKPSNFTWAKLWEGSGTGPTAFVNGLYNVIWCGSAASGLVSYLFFYWRLIQGLSVGTRARALFLYFQSPWPCTNHQMSAPLGMIAVCIFINISYFAVVKADE